MEPYLSTCVQSHKEAQKAQICSLPYLRELSFRAPRFLCPLCFFVALRRGSES